MFTGSSSCADDVPATGRWVLEGHAVEVYKGDGDVVHQRRATSQRRDDSAVQLEKPVAWSPSFRGRIGTSFRPIDRNPAAQVPSNSRRGRGGTRASQTGGPTTRYLDGNCCDPPFAVLASLTSTVAEIPFGSKRSVVAFPAYPKRSSARACLQQMPTTERPASTDAVVPQATGAAMAILQQHEPTLQQVRSYRTLAEHHPSECAEQRRRRLVRVYSEPCVERRHGAFRCKTLVRLGSRTRFMRVVPPFGAVSLPSKLLSINSRPPALRQRQRRHYDQQLERLQRQQLQLPVFHTPDSGLLSEPPSAIGSESLVNEGTAAMSYRSSLPRAVVYLLMCDSILQAILIKVTPSSAEKILKTQMFNALATFLKAWMGNSVRIFAAGSSAYDVDSTASDLDIVVTTTFEANHLAVLQKLSDLIQTAQRSCHNNQLQWPLVSLEQELVQSARVPILLLKSPRGIVCDISVNTENSICHTEFFKRILREKGYLRALMRFVKHWVKIRKLPAAREGGLPSIVWMLLCVLTSRHGEVCYSDRAMQSSRNQGCEGRSIDRFASSFTRWMWSLSIPLPVSVSSYTVLLGEFFSRLCSRAALSCTVSLAAGLCIPKAQDDVAQRVLSPSAHVGVWDELLSVEDPANYDTAFLPNALLIPPEDLVTRPFVAPCVSQNGIPAPGFSDLAAKISSATWLVYQHELRRSHLLIQEVIQEFYNFQSSPALQTLKIDHLTSLLVCLYEGCPAARYKIPARLTTWPGVAGLHNFAKKEPPLSALGVLSQPSPSPQSLTTHGAIVNPPDAFDIALVLLRGRLVLVRLTKICVDSAGWWSSEFLSRRDIRSVIHGKPLYTMVIPEFRSKSYRSTTTISYRLEDRVLRSAPVDGNRWILFDLSQFNHILDWFHMRDDGGYLSNYFRQFYRDGRTEPLDTSLPSRVDSEAEILFNPCNLVCLFKGKPVWGSTHLWELHGDELYTFFELLRIARAAPYWFSAIKRSTEAEKQQTSLAAALELQPPVGQCRHCLQHGWVTFFGDLGLPHEPLNLTDPGKIVTAANRRGDSSWIIGNATSCFTQIFGSIFGRSPEHGLLYVEPSTEDPRAADRPPPEVLHELRTMAQFELNKAVQYEAQKFDAPLTPLPPASGAFHAGNRTLQTEGISYILSGHTLHASTFESHRLPATQNVGLLSSSLKRGAYSPFNAAVSLMIARGQPLHPSFGTFIATTTVVGVPMTLQPVRSPATLTPDTPLSPAEHPLAASPSLFNIVDIGSSTALDVDNDAALLSAAKQRRVNEDSNATSTHVSFEDSNSRVMLPPEKAEQLQKKSLLAEPVDEGESLLSIPSFASVQAESSLDSERLSCSHSVRHLEFSSREKADVRRKKEDIKTVSSLQSANPETHEEEEEEEEEFFPMSPQLEASPRTGDWSSQSAPNDHRSRFFGSRVPNKCRSDLPRYIPPSQRRSALPQEPVSQGGSSDEATSNVSHHASEQRQKQQRKRDFHHYSPRRRWREDPGKDDDPGGGGTSSFTKTANHGASSSLDSYKGGGGAAASQRQPSGSEEKGGNTTRDWRSHSNIHASRPAEIADSSPTIVSPVTRTSTMQHCNTQQLLLPVTLPSIHALSSATRAKPAIPKRTFSMGGPSTRVRFPHTHGERHAHEQQSVVAPLKVRRCSQGGRHEQQQRLLRRRRLCTWLAPASPPSSSSPATSRSFRGTRKIAAPLATTVTMKSSVLFKSPPQSPLQNSTVPFTSCSSTTSIEPPNYSMPAGTHVTVGHAPSPLSFETILTDATTSSTWAASDSAVSQEESSLERTAAHRRHRETLDYTSHQYQSICHTLSQHMMPGPSSTKFSRSSHRMRDDPRLHRKSPTTSWRAL